MPRVVFYELPAGPHWSGVAQLVSHLSDRGMLTVVVGTQEEAQQLSVEMWKLPPTVYVPHGIAGLDADEELDPIVVSVGTPASRRDTVVHASSVVDELHSADLVAEVVPHETQLRQASRHRFKAYKERGADPEFLTWEAWRSKATSPGR
jgi:DNA polymerase IIIc chi subunit